MTFFHAHGEHSKKTTFASSSLIYTVCKLTCITALDAKDTMLVCTANVIKKTVPFSVSFFVLALFSI